nr:J domain-containing protein [uncultured Marinobacter sp.]
MTCWEILGIEPTRDHDRIRAAYEQQLKFASTEEASRLEQAFREAAGELPVPEGRDEPETEAPVAAVAEQTSHEDTGAERPLDANEGQVVREVVIQVKALLNDSGRSQDLGIWKAILCEPPADQGPIRREIARTLEPQLRPMAENGSFPAPVARFMGEWFDWHSLADLSEPDEVAPHHEPGATQANGAEQPQMVNFWPAVIGWIVGLAILATLFGGMGGN